MAKLSSGEAILALADRESYLSWDEETRPIYPIYDDYQSDLTNARHSTGCDEAVTTGEIRVGGVRAAVLAWEFGFLGGSVGVATATRLVTAIRRATAEGLPVLVLPRSGGTRMQEGTPAFVQMVAIAGAVVAHRAAGLPFLVHLGGPTTGGVLATVGSAGDLTTAEPGAMIGFLGPRAYRAITGQSFPEGVQTAENLLAHGIVDAVLALPELRERWATLLHLWQDRPHPARSPGEARSPGGTRDVPGRPQGPEQLWSYVAATRAHDRVDATRFVSDHMTDVVVLPGTAAGDRADGALVALGRLRGLPVVVAATEDRWTGQPLTVGSLRTIRRGIALAQGWGLPLVTIVDTLGAQLSVSGEQSGIAGEISRVMSDLVGARTATAALLLGAGTGGAALALLAADRIVAGSHTWVAPLAPEGAAAIRHAGPHDPAEIAWQQRIGAHALAELGVLDVVVRESDPDWVARAAEHLVAELHGVLAGVDPGRRVGRFAAWSATV